MQSYSANMTLEEQIGQLLVVGFQGTTVPEEIVELIQHYHVGNIIFFSRNIQDAQQVRELTRSLQAIARAAGQPLPLLICTDQENGMVRRLGTDATLFPGNMTMGAIGSEDIAYAVALASGRELKALGIDLNLAPVADVNNNPANPVIGVRSFGEDPQQVARLTAATVKGYRAAGVITSLKHFPGHGDTTVDSHLALPTVPYTLERLEKIELKPFLSGIEAGADSIMIAHLYLPALMSQSMLPATVSPEIIQSLLREQLGYDGVVLSDCLEMNAVAQTIGTVQGAVMALQAGNDLILVSHQYALQVDSIKAIRAALEAGTVTTEQVRQAAERVLQLKERMLSWHEPTDAMAWVGCADHQQLQKQAYELSTTLVRNDDGLVPLCLKPEQQILVLLSQTSTYTIAMDTDKVRPDELFIEQLRQRHQRVKALTLAAYAVAGEDAKIQRLVSESDLIIVVTVNAHLNVHQQEVMKKLLQIKRAVIGLAVLNPYDLLAFPQLSTYMVTYEYTHPALTTAVRVLFGELPARGRLPVSLPGLYPLVTLHSHP